MGVTTHEAEAVPSARTRASAHPRAAVLVAPHTMRTDALEPPEPGRGHVRVRLTGCGVCASSIPVWEGRPWFTYPSAPGAPGHEGWGVIDAVGPGVAGLAIGTPVAALSYHAFADYDIAAADAVVPIPAALATRALPGEPLGCAVNAFGRSDVQAGQDVAVIGIGFLGALFVQLAVGAGARVIAISRRPFAREIARVAGAVEVLATDDPAAVVRRVEQLTGGRGCDRVIEAVGRQEGLDLAAPLTRERGRLVIAGYHQDGHRQIDMQLWNWRGIDVINAHERDPHRYVDGIRRAVALVASGALDPDPLYTHRFGLDEVGVALQMAADRPHGFLKALVLT